jgi:hypothetical protein
LTFVAIWSAIDKEYGIQMFLKNDQNISDNQSFSFSFFSKIFQVTINHFYSKLAKIPLRG